MKKIKNDLPEIINSYFTKHLMLERQFSDTTYNTYLTVVKQFISFMNDNGIRNDKLAIGDFTKDNILKFLQYVEEQGCSPKTRNHKLAVINSFLEYAQSINPVHLDSYMQSKSIKFKKVIKQKMDFMTIDETKAFFKTINLKTKSGYKHYVILTILYETATRVSELINIKVEDCFITTDHPYIRILGKGNKERIVYINDNVVSMINEYMHKFNIRDGYLIRNHSNKQYTRYGINKLIDKYYELSKNDCPSLANKTISPHTFRHSKAVHFLQNGTALPVIQRFLGHSSIQTTEIYLDITNEVVIEAVKLAADILKSDKVEAIWGNDEKLLELLESLSK